MLRPRVLILLATMLLPVPAVGNIRHGDYYPTPPYGVDAGVTVASAVDGELFFELPEQRQADALQVLGEKDVMPLSSEQLSSLLDTEPDLDELVNDLARRIELSARSAERRAEYQIRKGLLEEDRYAYEKEVEHRKYLKRAATRDREHAAHLRKVRQRLRPYLIKLSAKNKPIGEYQAWASQGTLHVLNTTYVDSFELRPYPVIVYLSEAPERLAEELVPTNP